MSPRADQSQNDGMPSHIVDELVARSIAEDLGRAGDITSAAVVPADAWLTADLVARRDGVIAGMQCLSATTDAITRNRPGALEAMTVTQHVADGTFVSAGTCLARISGPARSVLAAERTALNAIGHLSGIATLTRTYVNAIAGTSAAICCTRKTTPGLRAAEKYAVRMGGARNHRFGLDDAVLIKDNHIAVAGGDIATVLTQARDRVGHLVRIEIEVDTLDQLDEVLANARNADVVMLDNMAPATLRAAVDRVGGRLVTEASGGVTLESVRVIAETGVDLISVGALTHSAPSLDVALDFATPAA